MSHLIKLITISLIAAALIWQPAFSEDLFDDNSSHDFKSVSFLSNDSTIGGYPIYQGGRTWKVRSGKSTLNNVNWRLAHVNLTSSINDDYFAEMYLMVNIDERRGSYTANPCSGSHLVAVNKGGGVNDNCLTIDPYSATVGGKSITTLQIKIRNSQTSARLYDFNLLLNVTHLGFPDTSTYDWAEDSIKRDSSKTKLIEKIISWAKRLQDGVDKAIDYKKPKNAFDGVPPINDLLAVASEASTVTVPKYETPVATPTPTPTPTSKTIEQRLSELKSLLDKGFITKYQYDNKSTEIIKDF